MKVYKPTSYLSLTIDGMNIDISFSNLELYTKSTCDKGMVVGERGHVVNRTRIDQAQIQEFIFQGRSVFAGVLGLPVGPGQRPVGDPEGGFPLKFLGIRNLTSLLS